MYDYMSLYVVRCYCISCMLYVFLYLRCMIDCMVYVYVSMSICLDCMFVRIVVDIVDCMVDMVVVCLV